MLVKEPKSQMQPARAQNLIRIQPGQYKNLVHIFLVGIFQTLKGERD